MDSVWIHLDPAQRPARIEGFGVYGEATGGRRRRRSSSCPTHRPAHPPEPWPLRVTDIDLHGHVNNAVHWQAVEQLLPQGGLDPRRPLVAELDYRQPIDLDDRIELVAAPGGEELLVGFRTREGRQRGGSRRSAIASPQAAPRASLNSAPCFRLTVRRRIPSGSQVTRLTWPERICGCLMIRADAGGTGSRPSAAYENFSSS